MSAVVCLFLTVWIVSVVGDEHSLFYIYTALSKPLNLPGIHEFTALGMLDDRVIDYYNSKNQHKTPKLQWLREKMPVEYWVDGTVSRKHKEHWFKVNLDILMDRMRHNKADLHVLQWRHGCVIDEDADGKITFVRGVSEYAYDGAEFISFDKIASTWIAAVPAADLTKRKWDEDDDLNQNTNDYLEKKCVNWLTKFMNYGRDELRSHSPPDVHGFAKKSVTDSHKLTVTCHATSFYPSDVQMFLRRSRTSLPANMITASVIRPNGDGTYQLRKSVEIREDDKSYYDSYVTHSTLKTPITVQLNVECNNCVLKKVWSGIYGSVIGALVMSALVGVVICFLHQRGIMISSAFQNIRRNGRSPTTMISNFLYTRLPADWDQVCLIRSVLAGNCSLVLSCWCALILILLVVSHILYSRRIKYTS